MAARQLRDRRLAGNRVGVKTCIQTRRWITAIGLALPLASGAVLAQHEEKSADAVAKELSNPAGSLASLTNNIEYMTYKGDLPGAGSQDGWTYSFQPVLPFPVGDQGRQIIFRPLIPVPLNHPVFNSEKGGDRPIYLHSGSYSTHVTPGPGAFESANINLGDITFDLVYSGTEMKDKHDGILWGIGAAGTLPTATDGDLGGDQWRLGPEVFGGIIRTWGLVGALVSHQWNVGGSNDDTHSVTAAQYFYAYGLGKGWQIASGPVITYDWEADSDQAWTVPLGIGLAKTTRLGGKPWKFQAQVQYYAVQPDAFGAEWLLKFSITPVIKNPFVRE